MPEKTVQPQAPKKRRRRAFIIKSFCAVVAAGIALFAVEEALGPLSSPEFCGSCHEMKDVHESWRLSPHHTNRSGVRVACVACHLPPRENRLAYLSAKAGSGAKDAWVHFFGEYDGERARRTTLDSLPSARCLNCHDNLLGDPSSSSVAVVHKIVVDRPDGGAYACVKCHDRLHGPKEPPPAKKTYPRADNSFCFVCHLNFKKEEFVLVHAAGGVGCVKCHGETLEHADDEDHTTPPDIMYDTSAVNASCLTAECHPRAEMEKEIGHRPFYDGTDAERTTCTDCHGKHRLEVRQRRWDRQTRKLIWRDGYDVDPDDPDGGAGPDGL